MFTATNNTFNKFQRNTWKGSNLDLLNNSSLPRTQNTGILDNQRNSSQAPTNPKTLTESLQSNIYSTLKTKEKEFVRDINYYNNINRYNVPKQAHLEMTASINPNKKRLVRGDSFTNEGQPSRNFHGRRNSVAKNLFSTKIQTGNEEDFLDRFIKRQVNRKAYYMDNKNMERINGEKHPQFLQNNEFLRNKENKTSFDPHSFDHMKKHRLLPNSTVVDMQYKDIAMEKQLHQNYQRILNQQMMYNDVNKMNIGKYQRMTKEMKEPVVFDEGDTNNIEEGLKKTMMGYHQR